MSKKWLFLRGEWDSRTLLSLNDNSDMWVQLFREIAGDDEYTIYFENGLKYSSLPESPTHIFSRGGFSWQSDIIKKYPDAYKIYYGAGRRFFPPVYEFSDFDLILVDTEQQKKQTLDIYPNKRVELFIKPAAAHFKPMECMKVYDVCYIANGQQSSIKGIEWVYKTFPMDMNMLHLGYGPCFEPPPNVTCRRVDRIGMPFWINRCRVGIVPYASVDSCPRVIPEMQACGLPIVAFDNVNIGNDYVVDKVDRCEFWFNVKKVVSYSNLFLDTLSKDNAKRYKQNLSIPVAANKVKDLL